MNSKNINLQEQIFEINPTAVIQYLKWTQGKIFIAGTYKLVLEFWRFDTRRCQKSLIQKYRPNVRNDSGYHCFSKDSGCSYFENNILFIVPSRNKIVRKLITWHKSLMIVKSNPIIGVIIITSRLFIWDPLTGAQIASQISPKYFLSKIDYKWDCKEIVCILKDQLSVMNNSGVIIRQVDIIKKNHQRLYVRRLEYTPDGICIVGLIHITEKTQQIYICLWQSSDLKCIWQIEGEFIDICISKNSQFIFANLQSKLHCYSIKSGCLIGQFSDFSFQFRQYYQSLQISPNSQYLIAINNKKISIFDLQSLPLNNI